MERTIDKIIKVCYPYFKGTLKYLRRFIVVKYTIKDTYI